MSTVRSIPAPQAQAAARRTWSDELGRTCLYAVPEDPRFSYCMVVPHGLHRAAGGRIPLVVAVHGTERDATGMRDALTPWATAHDVAVLAPLFPAGVGEDGDPDDVDAYKLLRLGSLPFDDVLMAMVRDATMRIGPVGERLHLVGFSGGAQFVLRFTYLHPERVASASVAAPGRVTLLDADLDWWQGTRDVATLTGRAVDLEQLRCVTLQLVVGARDDDPHSPRTQRARLLYDNLRGHALDVHLDVVPGARHDLTPLVPAITEFLGDLLSPPGRNVECHPSQ